MSGYTTGHLRRSIENLEAKVSGALRGGGLSQRHVEYYRDHPAEWQRRMFRLLMVSCAGLRTLQREALEITLRNATRVPALALVHALKDAGSPNTVLEKAVACWQVDEELAHEQFEARFIFPEPHL
jgi:hypothetical protein